MWSSWLGLTLRLSLWPSPARNRAVSPRRPCPPRARSTGIRRPLTDNNGRLQEDLTCRIAGASGMDGPPGRAFQARDAGSIPVTRSTLASPDEVDSPFGAAVF
jgi:hypothetical protein